MKDFDEYQEATKETAIYPKALTSATGAIMYTALGLAGEAGEVANAVKKMYRDGSPYSLENMEKELGDVLWYLARVADETGLTLSSVARSNLAKLQDRKERGVLGGSGDER